MAFEQVIEAYGDKLIGLGGGGSSSAGHTIESSDGTDMSPQPNLQFADAHVTNDSTNNRTKVEVVNEITQSDFDDLDETDAANDGLYSIDGGSTTLLTDNMIAHDATHTVRDSINSIENNLDGLDSKLDIFYKLFMYPSSTLQNIDINEVMQTGIYRLNGSITHSASGNYGILMVFAVGTSECRQIQFASGTIDIYTRIYTSSNGWTNWHALTIS